MALKTINVKGVVIGMMDSMELIGTSFSAMQINKNDETTMYRLVVMTEQQYEDFMIGKTIDPRCSGFLDDV